MNTTNNYENLWVSVLYGSPPPPGIQEVNSTLFNHLHQIKAHKLEQLTGPSNTCDSSTESLNTVVTIPENFPLSDAEKSVLSKGLNFVPISKKLE